jgi:argininosuccinate lyase
MEFPSENQILGSREDQDITKHSIQNSINYHQLKLNLATLDSKSMEAILKDLHALKQSSESQYMLVETNVEELHHLASVEEAPWLFDAAYFLGFSQ